jgi:hypothetical protein
MGRGVTVRGHPQVMGLRGCKLSGTKGTIKNCHHLLPQRANEPPATAAATRSKRDDDPIGWTRYLVGAAVSQLDPGGGRIAQVGAIGDTEQGRAVAPLEVKVAVGHFAGYDGPCTAQLADVQCWAVARRRPFAATWAAAADHPKLRAPPVRRLEFRSNGSNVITKISHRLVCVQADFVIWFDRDRQRAGSASHRERLRTRFDKRISCPE